MIRRLLRLVRRLLCGPDPKGQYWKRDGSWTFIEDDDEKRE